MATNTRYTAFFQPPTSYGYPIPGTVGYGRSQPLTPGTLPANPGLRSTTTDVYGTATVAGCNLITDPTWRQRCMDAAAVIGGLLPGGGAGGGATLPPFQPTPCPDGYVSDGKGGCKLAGMAPYIPGDIGRPDYVWQPVYGRYGAGVTPVAMQTSRRVCPPGYVVGKDGVCYDRIAKTNRAHNPGTKPFLTGGQVNAIRTARRLEKRFRKLQTGKNALFRAPKKCAPPKKGKR
jgi:hypothetical protein